MLSFKQFLREYSLEDPAPRRSGRMNPRGITQKAVLPGARGVRGMVFRGDEEKPDRKLRTYFMNKNATWSGRQDIDLPPVASGTRKRTGMYAAPSAYQVSPYVGIERDEPRAWTGNTLYTRKGGDTNRSSYVTAYKAANFRTLGSGERFSSNPGKAVGQFKVQNSTQFRQRYRQEKQVKDIKRTARRLQKSGKMQGGENL